jgi:methylglutaconyl-CoA hydratase
MYHFPMFLSLERAHGGRVARVTYDNSRRGNCFDQDLLTALVEALEEAAADDACAVIRLELTGKNFCGGWDTSSFQALAAAGADALATNLRENDETLGRIRRLPVPVVAAVRGQVIGFGVGLLSALHLPVAASDVRLSLPEVRYGFAPAGVGHTIAQALPRAQAYSLLTGTPANAQQLLTWGLVTRVVDPANLDAEVEELTQSLATIPGDALRAVVEVVESSLATGTPAAAYRASARTIVHGPEGEAP